MGEFRDTAPLSCTPGKRGGYGGGERTLSPFPPLFIPRFFFLREFFPRALLSERLEQATTKPCTQPFLISSRNAPGALRDDTKRLSAARTFFCPSTQSSPTRVAGRNRSKETIREVSNFLSNSVTIINRVPRSVAFEYLSFPADGKRTIAAASDARRLYSLRCATCLFFLVCLLFLRLREKIALALPVGDFQL